MDKLGDLEPFDYPDAPSPDEEGGASTWGDYGALVKEGAYKAVGQLAGAGKYLSEKVGGVEPEALTGLDDTIKWSEERAKEASTPLSATAKRRSALPVLVPDANGKTIWSEGFGGALDAIGLKLAGSAAGTLAPMAAAVVSAPIAGAAMATVVAGGLAAGLTAGEVFNDLSEAPLKAPHDELLKDPTYAGLISMGVPEQEARAMLAEDIVGNKPLYMGAITAVLSKFGGEGMLAKQLAEGTKKGVLKRIGTGALREGATEAPEEAAQSLLTQQGKVELGQQAALDFLEALEAGAQGALLGAASGGPLGIVHGGKSAPGQTITVGDVDPAAEQALASEQGNESAEQGNERTPVTPIEHLDEASAGLDELDQQITAAEVNGIDPENPAAPGAEAAKAVSKKRTRSKRQKTITVQPDGVAPEEAQALAEPAEEPAPAPAPIQSTIAAQPTPATPPAAAIEPVSGTDETLAEPVDLEYDADHELAPPAAAIVTEPMESAGVEAVAPPAQPAPPASEAGLEQTSAADLSPALPTPPAAGVAPDPAPGPKVLVDEQAEAKLRQELEEQAKARGDLKETEAKRARDQARASKDEAARIVKGEAVAATLPQSEDEFRSEAGRKRVRSLAKKAVAAAEKEGVEAPAWAREAVASIAKTARKNAQTVRNEGHAQLERAWRAALAEREAKVEAKPELAKRVTTKEADARERQEKAATAAAQAKTAIADTPLPPPAQKGLRPAVRAYLDEVLGKAKQAGIDLPVTPAKDTDPHVLHLVEARALSHALNPKLALDADQAAALKDRVQSFLTNDFMLRSGAAEEISSYRETQSEKRSASYDENATVDGKVDDTADIQEQLDAPTTVAETAQADAIAAAPELDKAPEPAQERPKPEVKVEEAVTAGKDKAGTFAVTTIKRRTAPGKVTPTGKPIKLEPKSERRGAPTEAQKQAGNYAKDHLSVAGLGITIENRKGSTRSGVGPDGKKWSVTMPAHYGYIKRSEGADGDQVDVYLGPRAVPGSELVKRDAVFIVNQKDLATGKFDEHKVLLGFGSREAALETYEKGFSDGRGQERIASVSEMTFDGFKEWLGEGKQTKPATVEPELDRVYRAEAQGWDTVDTAPDKATTEGRFPATHRGPLSEFLKTFDYDALEMAGEIAGLERAIGKKFAERVRKLAGDVPVYVVDYATMAALNADHVVAGGRPPLGYYSPSQDHIVLREDALTYEADAARLILHEGLHAAYLHALRLPANVDVRAQLVELMSTARNWHAAEATATWITEGYRPRKPYGFTNIDEFVSEAFSDPRFQQLLARTPVHNPARHGIVGRALSAWDLFIASVRKLVGLGGVRGSALEGVIRAVQTLEERMQGVRPLPDSMLENAVAPKLDTSEAVAALGDQASGFGHDVRRWGLKGATLDQIRQLGRGLFVGQDGSDLLERVVGAVQKITPYANRLRDDGEKLAQRYVELRQKTPTEAEAFAELAIDATMANVNLGPGADNTHLGKDAASGWQAKAHLAAMQSRFAGLSDEAQALWRDMAAYYRKTQNDIAKALVSNILDTLDKPLTPQQRSEITNKVLAGTLDDGDRKAIGNATIFRSLRDAIEVRAIKGVYFPLMRHGRYVVRTTDPVGDLMGGKEIEPGVVEFRAATDKDARAAAKAFAQKSQLPVLSIRKAYFLRSNGKQVSATNAVGQDVDTAYRVRVQREGAHFFDTAAEAERFRRSAGKDYGQVSQVLDKADLEARGDLTSSQLAAIMNSITQRVDIPASTKEMMRTAMGQAAVRLMAGNRVQQRSLTRRNVAGASADFGRNALTYAEASSRYLGKLRYMPGVRDALAEMRTAAKQGRYDKDEARRSQYLNELTKRIERNVTDPSEPPRWVSGLMTLSFLDKLFSPAYSVINAMQPWMVTYPVLAGRHGAAQAVLQLTRAYNDIGAGRVTLGGIGNTGKALRQVRQVGLLDTADLPGSIRRNIAKADDGKELVALLDTLVERGAMDAGAGFEIAAAVASGSGPVGTALAKVDRIARQLPIAVEQVNRATSAIAAYRLAKAQGKSAEQASSYALDVTMNTQGDYSAMNTPPAFNHPVARLSLQFKKYAQLMSFLMVDMTKRAFGPNATREERQVALKQLAQLVAVQVAMAGTLSLPGLELVKLATMLAGVLGLGGGWDELERWLRKLHDEALGKTWGELVSRGVLSRGLQGLGFGAIGGHGIDLSSRLSLADMWTFGEPKTSDSEGAWAYLARLVAGAPGGLMMEWGEAVRHATKGEWGKAAEKAIPTKFVADMAQAVRKREAGEITTGEAILKGVGFRSGRMAEAGEQIGRAKKDKERSESRRKELTSAYLDARTPAERAKVVSRIREHNKTAGFRDKVHVGGLDKVKVKKARERRELLGAD